MKIQILFEDSLELPANKLFKEKSYASIHFCGGNSRLAEKFEELYNEEDFFVVYFDYPCNNAAITKEYSRTIKKITRYFKRNYIRVGLNIPKNFCLIPILGFEFITLKSLSKPIQDLTDYIKTIFSVGIKEVDVSKICSLIKNDNNFKNPTKLEKCNTLEHFYKIVLNELLPERFGNYFSENPIVGSYYDTAIKADLIYYSLPIFFIDPLLRNRLSKNNLEIKVIDTAEINIKILTFYEKLFDYYKEDFDMFKVKLQTINIL